jgi:hypothetical protein
MEEGQIYRSLFSANSFLLCTSAFQVLPTSDHGYHRITYLMSLIYQLKKSKLVGPKVKQTSVAVVVVSKRFSIFGGFEVFFCICGPVCNVEANK